MVYKSVCVLACNYKERQACFHSAAADALAFCLDLGCCTCFPFPSCSSAASSYLTWSIHVVAEGVCERECDCVGVFECGRGGWCSVCVCTYMYTCICIHAHAHVYTHTHTRTRPRVHVHVHVHAHETLRGGRDLGGVKRGVHMGWLRLVGSIKL